jgi:hypothetical protein
MLLLLAGCGAAPPASLYERALLRRGGLERLRRTAGFVRSSTGTLRGLAYSRRTSYRYPNQLRVHTEFEGTETVLEWVFDGRHGYQQIGDRKLQLGPEQARIIRNQCLDESVFWLLVLTDPNLTVAELDSAEFQGQPARAMRVEHWSGYSRELFFDQDSSELLGSQGLAWTQEGRVMTTTVYSDYQDHGGLRLPMSQETLVDGQPHARETHHSIRLSGIPQAEEFQFR